MPQPLGSNHSALSAREVPGACSPRAYATPAVRPARTGDSGPSRGRPGPAGEGRGALPRLASRGRDRRINSPVTSSGVARRAALPQEIGAVPDCRGGGPLALGACSAFPPPPLHGAQSVSPPGQGTCAAALGSLRTSRFGGVARGSFAEVCAVEGSGFCRSGAGFTWAWAGTQFGREGGRRSYLIPMERKNHT